mmetsp:Transcript_6530/g.15687  ORF Transcript_6530/g.15687 Transcript_6530/m.15687 type:complete len:202 (-) Transcript_6530:355-960(-)
MCLLRRFSREKLSVLSTSTTMVRKVLKGKQCALQLTASLRASFSLQCSTLLSISWRPWLAGSALATRTARSPRPWTRQAGPGRTLSRPLGRVWMVLPRKTKPLPPRMGRFPSRRMSRISWPVTTTKGLQKWACSPASRSRCTTSLRASQRLLAHWRSPARASPLRLRSPSTTSPRASAWPCPCTTPRAASSRASSGPSSRG